MHKEFAMLIELHSHKIVGGINFITWIFSQPPHTGAPANNF